MNTNQVMPMAAGAQVSRKASSLSVKGKDIAQGKNDSFNDVLAKSKYSDTKEDSLTLQDVKDLAKSAEAADKEAKLAETAKGASTEAEAPKNTKNEEATCEKVLSAKDSVNTSDIVKVEDIDVEANFVVVNPLSAVVTSHDIDGIPIDDNASEALKMSQPDLELNKQEVSRFNLQTILPQSNEASAKHTEMLQMLSGQLVPKNQDAVKNPNLSDSESVKIPANFKAEVDTRQNADAPQFVQKMPTDPLSAIASEMAKGKNANVTPNIVSNVNPSINNDVKAVVNNNVNVEVNVNINANSGDKVGVPLENLSTKPQDNMVFDGKNTLNDKPKEVSVLSEIVNVEVENEVKSGAVASKIENAAIKTEPLAANVVVPEKNQNQSSNPLAGMTIEVEDEEGIPAPRFQDFGQDGADNSSERQPMFDGRRNDVFRMQDGVRNNVNDGRSQVEPQTFSAHLETQNNNASQNVRESAPLPQMPRDDFNVRNQIVEQARLIRQENGSEMVIRLKPEHLGNLTLRISVSSEGSVTASFFTNNHEVRNIVENSLVQLRQELQNQGLKVDKTEVYAGLSDGSLPQGQGQEAWQQNNGRGSSRGNFRNVENDAIAFEEISNDASQQSANVGAADGVDYLV